MLTREGSLLSTFGVMGGFMQPQGHVQVVCNMLDFGMGPQDLTLSRILTLILTLIPTLNLKPHTRYP